VCPVRFWVSAPFFYFCGNSSAVEHRLAKARVAGSNPVFRSIFIKINEAASPSGKAEDCKSFILGSNPSAASICFYSEGFLIAQVGG
jgi:hypothetical protein